MIDVPSGQSGTSFSAIATGLNPFTTYFYKAYVKEGSETNFRYGDIHSFTTNASSGLTPGGSLEIPGSAGNADKVVTITRESGATNYTVNYSYSRCAPLWTAYSLTESDVLDVELRAGWSYYSGIANKYQPNVGSSSYPSNYPNTNYPYLSSSNNFDRGHQIPAADRYNTADKNQTYLLINQTPQLHTGFNNGIWKNLEDAGREFVVTKTGSSYYNDSFKQTETLYIVTGPCYQKAGGNETVYQLSGSSVEPTSIPVPNYYWKAYLKVRRSGNTIVSASAIGFWFIHKELSDTYTDHVVSVDQIETWTGFDLFANLPDNVEPGAESNSNWIAFRDF